MDYPHIDKETQSKLHVIGNVIVSHPEELEKNIELKLRLENISKTISQNKPLSKKQHKLIDLLYDGIINHTTNSKTQTNIQTNTHTIDTNTNGFNVESVSEKDITNNTKPHKFDPLPEISDEQEKANYYQDFIGNKIKNQIWLKNQLVYLLHKQPKKDKDNPSYQAPKINSQHQADLLFLPYDKNNKNAHKFCLVVSDVHTRLIDAAPLKTKNADEVAKAFQTIYSRPILDPPIEIITDGGSEFKGECSKYFKDQDIFFKPQKAGKKIGIVDNKIKIIGDAIIKKEFAEQLLTMGDWADNWYDDLPVIVKLINEHTVKTYKPQTGLEKTDILYRKDGLVLIPLGTKVRIASYYPKDYHGNKLPGTMRSADIKWDIPPKTITDYIIRPNSPIMYVVDNDYTTYYTQNRLQIVSKDEQLPDRSILKSKEKYVSQHGKLSPPKKNKNVIVDQSQSNEKDIPQIQTRSGRVIKPTRFYDEL